MIVREAKDLTAVPIGATGLQGKLLVQKADNVGYVCYDINLEKGTTTLKSIDEGHNHVYYCFQGDGKVSMATWSKDLHPHVTAAFTATMVPSLVVMKPMKLLVTYVPAEQVRTEPEVCQLSDLLSTDRNVNWGNGHSRRFLTASNGLVM